MCVIEAFQALSFGLGVASTISQSEAIAQEARATSAAYEYQAQMKAVQEEQIGRQGMKQSSELARQQAYLEGSQKASIGASGVAQSSGTVSDISLFSYEAFKRNMAVINYNTALGQGEARQEANLLRTAGQNALVAGRQRQAGTLLGGANQIAGMGTNYIQGSTGRVQRGGNR